LSIDLDEEAAEDLDARTGQVGLPVDAVCVGCRSEGLKRIRVKRTSLSELGVDELEDADGKSFRHVCHRCQGSTYWNVVDVLHGLLRSTGGETDGE